MPVVGIVEGTPTVIANVVTPLTRLKLRFVPVARSQTRSQQEEMVNCITVVKSRDPCLVAVEAVVRYAVDLAVTRGGWGHMPTGVPIRTA